MCVDIQSYVFKKKSLNKKSGNIYIYIFVRLVAVYCIVVFVLVIHVEINV